jgi:hypothetical protein
MAENHFVTITLVQFESRFGWPRLGAQDSPIDKAFFDGFGALASGVQPCVSNFQMGRFVPIMADFVPFGGQSLAFRAN